MPTVDYEIDKRWIIGFTNIHDKAKPILYTIIFEGYNYYPIMTKDGFIIFYKNYYDTLKEYNKHGKIDVSVNRVRSQKDVIKYNVAKALYLIEKYNYDKNVEILDIINIFDDLLIAINMEVPSIYKKELYAFADHLTFSKSYGAYFKKKGTNRELIINAIYWCVGAMACRSVIK